MEFSEAESNMNDLVAEYESAYESRSFVEEEEEHDHSMDVSSKEIRMEDAQLEEDVHV